MACTMRTPLGLACALVAGITVIMAGDLGASAGLERLWWLAFTATAAAYVVVLGSLGVRRLRAVQPAPSAWLPLDIPAVTARPRQVRPHL